MSEMLSQEEINSLLNNTGTGNDADTQDTAPETTAEETIAAENEKLDIKDVLTEVEIDALGEIGNISMGSAATALSNLLSRRVDITTPVVTLTNTAELSQRYERPCVSVNVPYVEGLHGDNVLVIKMEDVKAITSLLIGSDEYSGGDVEISEIHLSAISEVMNQMMGSSATSLSQLTQMRINIAPPAAEVMDFSEKFAGNTIVGDSNDSLVAITFKMDVEDLFVTDIVLLMKPDFSKNMVASFFASNGVVIDAETQEEQMLEEATAAAAATVAQSASQPAPQPAPQQAPAAAAAPPVNNGMPVSDNAYAQGGYPPPYPYPPYPYPPQYPMNGVPQPPPAQNVNVQSVQFENFAPSPVQVPTENIGMLMDVPLQVSVELGKSKKTLRDILELNIGSIVTLDKTSGEMVDVIINGKMVAKGEVVVVDDNFAVRITEIFNNINKVL